jgi:lysyl-tRNA synthetase class 1
VLRGGVKVGWKVDWALRWYSYGVDYEMYGKDLIESAKLSSRIVRLMGGRPPLGLVYEMFLDQDGRKISKSVGRGITVDSWVSYAPLESLLYYLFQNPKRAKRLYWDVIPKSVDDYLALLSRDDEGSRKELEFIVGGIRPPYGSSVNFSLVNNLISGLGSDDPDLIRGCLMRYDPDIRNYPEVMNGLVDKGVLYYRDFTLPNKDYRDADDTEVALFRDMRERLAAYEGGDENEFQAIPFKTAETFGVKPASLFKAFYEVVLGQERGPRFGTLVRLLGREKILKMLDDASGAR